MTQQPIGVMGSPRTFPLEFPVTLSANAGDMIHGNAPFEMFPEAVFYKDRRFGPGRESFVNFVNGECSHLIVTFANLFKLDYDNGERYSTVRSALEKIEVPIVVFGVGAQARTTNLDGSLPPEAVDLMKFLGDRSNLVGVRGDFTSAVFEHFAGVKNTIVTGCPSFFSRPQVFVLLADAIRRGRSGRAAYSGTAYHDPLESQLLVQAIREDNHFVEPVNKFSTMYANALQRGEKDPTLPWFLKPSVRAKDVSLEQLESYFSRRFRIFRDPTSWYNFNAENVGFSYGTRFHANMASILSGVPAMWITHDSRTEELTKALRLPAISMENAVGLGSDEMRAMLDYRPMFDGLQDLFATFNFYLEAHDLPPAQLPNLDLDSVGTVMD